MKLTNKHKRGVKRRVELEQGVRPPGSSTFVDKKKYINIDYKLNTNTNG